MNIWYYRQAVGDGKRATMIKPSWAKVLISFIISHKKRKWNPVYPVTDQANDSYESQVNVSLCLQGHYRFCEALFLLGRVEMAIEKNAVARRLCKDNQEGLRELEHQHRKFTGTEEPRGTITAFMSWSQCHLNSHSIFITYHWFHINMDVVTVPQKWSQNISVACWWLAAV